MAHYKRKRPRTASSGYYSANGFQFRMGRDFDDHNWASRNPRWHDVLNNNRPARRKSRLLERKVMQGFDPDSLVWPLDKKPHTYYW